MRNETLYYPDLVKQRPWAIVLIAALHFLAPIGNILFNSFLADRDIADTWMYWRYIIPKSLFFAYMVLPIVAGVLIYLCKRWSYWAYIVCLLGIFAANLYGFSANMTLDRMFFLVFFLVGDLLVVGYFVVPSVRLVYMDPRMRWWETAPRYFFDVEGSLNGQGGARFKNISVGGLFVESAHKIEEGGKIEATWNYENQDYKLIGSAVYVKPMGQGFGYGVKFDEESTDTKRLKALTRVLHLKGKRIGDRDPSPEDSFFSWLKKLIFDQEGLFPKRK